MSNSLSPTKAPMPLPQKNLAAACQKPKSTDDNGCAQRIAALPEEPDRAWIDLSALKAARAAFDAAVDKRDERFDLTTALHRIAWAWMEAMEIDSDRQSTFKYVFREATKYFQASDETTDFPDRGYFIQFPVWRQSFRVPKVTQLRGDLKQVTQQVAEAC